MSQRDIDVAHATEERLLAAHEALAAAWDLIQHPRTHWSTDGEKLFARAAELRAGDRRRAAVPLLFPARRTGPRLSFTVTRG